MKCFATVLFISGLSVFGLEWLSADGRVKAAVMEFTGEFEILWQKFCL